MRTAIWVLAFCVLKVAKTLGMKDLSTEFAVFFSFLFAIYVLMDAFEFIAKAKGE